MRCALLQKWRRVSMRHRPSSRNGGGYRRDARPPPEMEEGIDATRALLQKWRRGGRRSILLTRALFQKWRRVSMRHAPSSRNGRGYRRDARPPPEMASRRRVVVVVIVLQRIGGGRRGGMPLSGHTAWRALPPRESPCAPFTTAGFTTPQPRGLSRSNSPPAASRQTSAFSSRRGLARLVPSYAPSRPPCSPSSPDPQGGREGGIDSVGHLQCDPMQERSGR
jgi:hypothetical protein